MMAQPHRQRSPLSMDSDSSVFNRYQGLGGDGPYATTRHSPPQSQYPSSSTDNTRPSDRSPNASNGHASSHSSVSRASNGPYSPVLSETGRALPPRHEEALQEHYNMLKGFLAPYLQRDTDMRPTRARDKLLRLSVTQFQELSTDVFDELLRREDARQYGPEVPRFLLPKNNFHPKRNQARQKLSTLPPERFRQLATDVYYELERRMPRLAGMDMDRAGSPATSVGSHPRGQSRSGMRRPGPPYRQPSGDQYYPRNPSNDMGRPLPRTFQANTMVPNKSTMVEDDSDDEFGLDRVVSGLSNRSPKKKGELEARIAELEGQLKEREEQQTQHDRTKADLEHRLEDLQQSSSTMRTQLDEANYEHSKRHAELQASMDMAVSNLENQLGRMKTENETLRSEPKVPLSEGEEQWRRRCEGLQSQLQTQQQVTEEVRQSAGEFLREMRVLSEQSEIAMEKEEKLRQQVASLQAEVEEWKSRYAKTKTQVRNLKATSMGLGVKPTIDNRSFEKADGLVSDVDVTNFQISINDLLQAAREASPEVVVDRTKDVVTHVRRITASDPKSLQSPIPPSPQVNGESLSAPELSGLISRYANSLITAARNHASSNGLSPVSLLDAAAGNLTAAVVDFVKIVGIKQSTYDVSPQRSPVKYGTSPAKYGSRSASPVKNGWHSRLKGSFDSSYSDEEFR